MLIHCNQLRCIEVNQQCMLRESHLGMTPIDTQTLPNFQIDCKIHRLVNSQKLVQIILLHNVR